MSGQNEDAVEAADLGAESAPSGGFDRRSLIKKAGVVGAAAWVAPMVIDSMISPASAASVATGTYRLRLSSSQCDPTPVRPPDPASPCAPVGYAATDFAVIDAAGLADLGITVVNCTPRFLLSAMSGQANVTFVAGASCKPGNRGGGPNPGVVTGGGSTITWANQGPADRLGYYIIINVA